jgi:putative redox protein
MNEVVAVRPEEVTVTTTTRGTYTVEIAVGPHRLTGDEPRGVGGTDLGPRPHEFLLGALGACTAMTLRMYADRKKIPLADVRVRLTHGKIKASDCPDCVSKEGEVEEITREITLIGDLDDPTRTRLLEIANKCPVHRTLTGEIKIRSSLTQAAAQA